MSKKLTTILALLLVAIFALSACGKPADPGVDGGTATPAPTDTASTEPTVSKADVIIWNSIFEDYNRNYYEKMGEEFNADPNNKTVNLIQEFVPGDAWEEKMKSAQAAGATPDIYLANYEKLILKASKGETQPLNDLIPQDAWDDLKDNVKQFITYDGKFWAYPQLVEPAVVLYYRTDLFEKAGLDPNKPPKTWDELIAYGKALKTDDVFALDMPYLGNIGWASWGWQLQASGHLALNDDWTAATTTDQGMVDLVNFWKTLYNEKIIPEQEIVGYADMRAYGEGAFAMKFCGSWGLGQLNIDFPDIAKVTKVAPAPTKDGNQARTTSTVGGWTYVVDAKAKNPKGAGEYIYWLLGSDPKRCADFFKESNYSKYSPRKSVDEFIKADPEGSKNEAMKIISEQILPYAAAEPFYPWDISLSMATAIENATINGMSAEEALKIREDFINTFLKDSGTKKPF